MSNPFRLVSAAIGLATLALVAACTEPPAADYQQRYALAVAPQAVTLVLQGSQAGVSFTSDDEAALSTFVAGYLDRGHGPITLAAPVRAAPGSTPTAAIDAVRARLIAAGVPAGSIVAGLTYQDAPAAVTLSYMRYEVALPICGDWTSSPTYDPYNEVHSNFGCANQRNIGLMVADPADLAHRREPAPTDAQNAGRVVQKYRAGQPTAATQSPLQTQGATGITSVGQ